MPQDFSGLDRETLGRVVRDEWTKWAKTQPAKTRKDHPAWFSPWETIPEHMREVDRLIGERVMAHVMAELTESSVAVRPTIGDRVIDREYPDRHGTLREGPVSWTEYLMDGTSNPGIVRTFARVMWDDGRFDWVSFFLLTKIADDLPALTGGEVIHVKGEVIDGPK